MPDGNKSDYQRYQIRIRYEAAVTHATIETTEKNRRHWRSEETDVIANKKTDVIASPEGVATS
ncbi:MAG: hypothetical protein DRR11_02920 [Gammaproteobacteria bacterium]|nr:MAG: hypothetical protein DRR11_02920 [Gammaproteobacteria bacterium]RLA38063.1 MAG: hypothetical protein DRR15_00135 [Gammaproteobacteria bacterium]